MVLKKDSAPRGIRNNNPLNIRENHLVDYDWQGEASADWDPDFEEFNEPVMGIRAAMKVLLTYRNTHGLNTVAGIINRWAPDSENDTQSYINSVADKLGVQPFTPLAMDEYPALIAAMIHHENGQQPYSAALINEGVNKAYA